jgi:hypothetical protein
VATKTGKGRAQRRRSPTGRARLPDLRKHYRFRQPPLEPGAFEFQLDLLRGKGSPPLPLLDIAESFEWRDEASVLEGSVTLRRPEPDRPASLPLRSGQRVRCRVRWAGSWYELWQMRCRMPQVQPVEGIVTVELMDDLDLLRRNRRDWKFRKTKRRKRGYYCHDIVRAVAKREGIKLGRIAKGKKRMSKLIRRDASALDMIRAAYAYERERTGRRFIIRLRNGRLEVLPYRRNTMVYELRDAIEDVQLTEEQAAHPVTVIEGKGKLGKGKDAKTVRHTEYRRPVVRRYGYVHREKNYGEVDSRADLRRKVRRDLAKATRVRRTGTVMHPLIPFIRRGEGMRWQTNEPGWRGESRESRDRSFVFITAARHRVSSNEQVSEFDFSQDDPFLKDKERMEREARDRKRKDRRKRQRGDQS